MQINIPNCEQFTKGLGQVFSLFGEFENALARREPLKAVNFKQDILNLKIENFDLFDSYDLDILFRAALCKNHDYFDVGRFNQQGTAVAFDQSSDRISVIDRRGKIIKVLNPGETPIDVKEFSREGIAIINYYLDKSDEYNYINSQGDLLLKSSGAREIRPFSEGFGCARIGKYWQFFGSSGIKKENEYAKIENAENFSEGIAFVEKNSKVFCIDYTGQKIAASESLGIKRVSRFSEGLAACQLADGKYYFINHEFEKVLGPFAKAKSFTEGKAWVHRGANYWSCIDHSGEEVFSLSVMEEHGERVDEFKDGFSRYRFIKRESEMVDSYTDSERRSAFSIYDIPESANITSYRDGFFTIEDDQKKYRMDKKGRKIFEWSVKNR